MGKSLIELPLGVSPGPLGDVLKWAGEARKALDAAQDAKSDQERIQHLERAISDLIRGQELLVTRLTGMDD